MNFFSEKTRRPEEEASSRWTTGLSFTGLSASSSIVYLAMLLPLPMKGHQKLLNEPSSSTSMVVQGSNSSMNIIKHSQIHHRRTNHDPILTTCLTNGPSYQAAHSTSSVGTFREGKENEPSKNKKKWFFWLKNGSKTKVVEACDKNEDHNGSAKTAHGIQQHQQASSSESSFKILQLTASPGGARKGYRGFHAELCDVAGRKETCLQEQSGPSFADTMRDIVLGNVASRENLDKKSLDNTDKHHDRLQTFSLSDVSSFGESEMLDSSSSFTQVTSLSSSQLSDCWGVLSDGQLPPSLSPSSSTDVLANYGEISDEEQEEVCKASATTSSDTSDAPERTVTTGTHGIVASDSTDFPASTDSSAIQGCGDAPCSAEIPLDTVHVSSESASIQACSNVVRSPDTPAVHVDASHGVRTVGEVLGGTITDVYALIVRTLNMGMHKSSDKHQALATNTSTAHQDISVSNESLHGKPSPKACLDSTERPCPDAEDAKSKVPEHSTPSLHKIHTEWLPKEHVNIEVLLGFKKPKNSFEALTVQRFMEEEGEEDSVKSRNPSTLKLK